MIYALQLFPVIIDMQNCTYFLNFDICIHPWNYCPNQDNKYICLLPQVSLCPFIDSFIHFYFKQLLIFFCHCGLNFQEFYIKQNLSVCTLFVWFLSLHIIILRITHVVKWRRKWQPTPVFLPGESQGRGSLVGCHLWGCRESDTAEAT